MDKQKASGGSSSGGFRFESYAVDMTFLTPPLYHVRRRNASVLFCTGRESLPWKGRCRDAVEAERYPWLAAAAAF